MHLPELEPVQAAGHSSTIAGRILSGAAMFVALVSLGLAAYEARMTREHDMLSVWPYVSVFNTGSGGAYTFNARNVGIGPALVQSFQVRVDGQPKRTWGEVVRSLVGQDASIIYSSFGHGTVLLPGANVELVKLEAGDVAAAVHLAVQKRMTARVCYCSLYRECWVLDDTKNEPPQPVSECQLDPAAEFSL
jgi:hypothetical protein